ncbi:MAG: tetratricopeptide repeat protein [Alphaproteobacteria bacterium]|nr:tetratricopeptide repeat protein [Alphaproteobacteria bacterium]
MRCLTLSFAAAILALFAGSAQAGLFGSESSDASSGKIDLKSMPTNLDDQIRRAQSLRAEGKYSEAVQSLGQLMLVAPDDARVVGEYGKVLAQEGRGADASAFLHRAVELNPNEWSYFSALGVAFDELGKPKDAQLAYQHALALKPGDPSVLNNYALSRMLAGDVSDAHQLMLQAKAAAGSDEKIDRNLALVDSKMIAPAVTAVQAPAPARAAETATHPVVHHQDHAVLTAALADPQASTPNVYMQHVPKDPLAGPVAKAKPSKHAKVARKHAAPSPAIAAKPKTPALRMSADAS